jgi:predicted AlkP superfamily pyrophosphatase or phosphodiesterase
LSHPTLVLNVVGLTARHLGDDTPFLRALAAGGSSAPLGTITPAVTCSVQATLLTGRLPREHGVVGNGWYFRDLAQVMFWRQSNRLVRGDKVWETARQRDPSISCAKLFWWFNMYSSANWSVTPRPIYPSDGRKIPDIYSEPADLCARLKAELGEFPFFSFWGPGADIRSSAWIGEAAIKVADWYRPTLSLVYLPHLDYNLQRLGPDNPAVRGDVRAIDRVCQRVVEHHRALGYRVIVLSEYGITPVTAPVHINRVLRKAGLLAVREELGLEALDAGASDAFAVADHQVAHVYVREPRRIAEVQALLERVDGIESVLDRSSQAEIGLDHENAGELVALARADRWFTYYYWLDDAVAPDFARTVDIHRKPGYDPVELFVDPAIAVPALKVGWTLLKKALGFRYLMDAIPLDATLVRGSHGRLTDDPLDGPVILSSERGLIGAQVKATEVRDVIVEHVLGAA